MSYKVLNEKCFQPGVHNPMKLLRLEGWIRTFQARTDAFATIKPIITKIPPVENN